MKKGLKKFMTLALGLSVIAFATSCSDDDDDNDVSLNGTYTGEVYAYIPGLVDDTYDQNFTVSGSKLSITLTVEIQGNTIPMPLSVNLTNITQGNMTEDGISVNGLFFNMEDKTIDVAIAGISIALKSDDSYSYNNKKYAGFCFSATLGGTKVTMFDMDITGTATVAGQSIPAYINVSGTR